MIYLHLPFHLQLIVRTKLLFVFLSLLFCCILAESSMGYSSLNPLIFTSSFDNLTAEIPSFTLPVSVSQREGCLSASEGEVYFYIGGGINRQTNQVFNDLYLIDTIGDTIISCSPSLPYPIYYSNSQWYEAMESLILYTGVVSLPGQNETYLTSTLLLNLSQSTSATCFYNLTSIPVPIIGRKYAASIIYNSRLYVFGHQ